MAKKSKQQNTTTTQSTTPTTQQPIPKVDQQSITPIKGGQKRKEIPVKDTVQDSKPKPIIEQSKLNTKVEIKKAKQTKQPTNVNDNSTQEVVQLPIDKVPTSTTTTSTIEAPTTKKSNNKYAAKNQQDKAAIANATSSSTTTSTPTTDKPSKKIKILQPALNQRSQTTFTLNENAIKVTSTTKSTTTNTTSTSTPTTKAKFDLSTYVPPVVPKQLPQPQQTLLFSQTISKRELKRAQRDFKDNADGNDNNTVGKTALQGTLEKKLQGAQFRFLNQQLYTTDSHEAIQLMQSQPELFEVYHQGFRTQVEKWPINPLTTIINKIKGYIAQLHRNNNDDKDESTTTNKNNVLTIADFGCGDAELALTLGKTAQILPFNNTTKTFINSDVIPKDAINTVCTIGKSCQIYSFDLVAPTTPNMCLPIIQSTPPTTTSVITPCDSRDVPIPSNSVDVAVFCLSLMGTNFKQFLTEAHRVLKPSKGGRSSLIIAEVRSRFDEQQKESNVANAKIGNKKGIDVYENFNRFVERLGFKRVTMDKSNTMFVLFEFIKTNDETSKQHHKKSRPTTQAEVDAGDDTNDFVLKPCIYKKR